MAVIPLEDMMDTCCTCSCDCVRHVENEKTKMRALVTSVMQKLEEEENINKKVKRKGEEEMEVITKKLAVLQKSLMSEQARVKSLLTHKDNIIRNLTQENRRLMKKLKLYKSSCSSPTDTGSSDCSGDVDLQSHASDTTENNDNQSNISEVSGNASPDQTMKIRCSGDNQTNQEMMIADQKSLIMMQPSDRNHHHQKNNDSKPPGQPKDNITKDEYNINNNIVNNEPLDYVIVTDNLIEPNLVVLDNSDKIDSTSHNLTDDMNFMTTTSSNSNRSTVLHISQTRAALRQMTNHRSAIKPSDIKHRDRVKTVTKEHKTLLSYWSDSFL